MAAPSTTLAAGPAQADASGVDAAPVASPAIIRLIPRDFVVTATADDGNAVTVSVPGEVPFERFGVVAAVAATRAIMSLENRAAAADGQRLADAVADRVVERLGRTAPATSPVRDIGLTVYVAPEAVMRARGVGISKRSPTRAEFLSLVPNILPDAAAQAAFILATSAEMSAVKRAFRSDVPKVLRAPMMIRVRGSKTDGRDRLVPIVTDEQVVLLRFAVRHAGGEGDRLFACFPNQLIKTACRNAGIAHVCPHHFRHAAGQWLLDLGVSIELVSRILGHSSTAITERVYARVKQDAVGDRILDEIDPSYVKGARRRSKRSDRRVATVDKIPEPKQPTTYEIRGATLTLDGWAKKSGIAKSTLYWRVVLQRRSMREALAMGSGHGRLSRQSPMADRSSPGKLPGNSGSDRPRSALVSDPDPHNPPGNSVGHDRLELSANGLRVRCSTN